MENILQKEVEALQQRLQPSDNQQNYLNEVEAKVLRINDILQSLEESWHYKYLKSFKGFNSNY